MTSTLTRAAIADAYLAACRLEVRTLKPGNVHVFADGHRMTVADFDTSAEVSAPFIADPSLRVGARVRHAVEATMAAVGQNTNLGILLLCAPLAAAAAIEESSGKSLDARLGQVLADLTHDDAREVYRAIAAANPAGLGEDKTGDVRSEPPLDWTLPDAMRAAASRDMIAAEYATAFQGIFANARRFAADLSSGAEPDHALAMIFMRELASRLDTHIVRKHGTDLARRVQNRAREVLADLDPLGRGAVSHSANESRLLILDQELKSWGVNPGSLADIACATAFCAALTPTPGLASS